MELLRRLIERLGPKQKGPHPGNDEWARVFDEARAATDGTVADALGRNHLVIVDPHGHLFLPVMPESALEGQLASARSIIAPEPRRSVAAIADTSVSGSLAEINKTIPFVGILAGLAYIGHRVIVFDGQINAIEQGCRGAEVLIVDGAVLPRLDPDWYSTARRAMRKPEMYLHDRTTFTLRPILPSS